MRSALVAAAIGASLLALPGLAHARANPAATTTGRLLVTLKPTTAAHAAAVHTVLARAGARTTDVKVPQLRLAAVRPPNGTSPGALARRLHADPRVADVRPERRFQPALRPQRPGLHHPERGESGTVTEWWAARENLPAAWDITRGDGARVAIIDTGVDGAHPELTNKIVATADFDDNLGDGPPTVDEDGHGTHVASLACAQPDNGIGIAGAGLGCNLLVAKSDLTESSVAKALVWAADNGAQAINMSFGTEGASPQRPRSSRRSTTPTARARCSSPRPPTTRSSSRATPPTSCSRPTAVLTSTRTSASRSPPPTPPMRARRSRAAERRSRWRRTAPTALAGQRAPRGVPVADHQPGAR